MKKVKKIAQRIQHTAGRMRGFIDDLLNYSNSALGKTNYQTEQLNTVVQEVLYDMEASVIEKGANIEVHELPSIKGDKRQLRQLFHNLLSNALKYHKPVEAPVVAIRSRITEGKEIEAFVPVNKDLTYYQIIVTDNGIGFRQEDADKIFGLFQRLPGKAEYEGTGIGLAICKKVVENYDGAIWAISAPQQGTTFSVALPVL